MTLIPDWLLWPLSVAVVGSLCILIWAVAMSLLRHPRNDDPISAWDQGHQQGLLVVRRFCTSDRELCDAIEAARLAHQHRIGGQG